MTAKRVVIQFRVTAKEKLAIQRAAKRAGMSLSVWLRTVADHGVHISTKATQFSTGAAQ